MHGNAHNFLHPDQPPPQPNARLAQRLAALIDGAAVHAIAVPEHASLGTAARASAALDWTPPERAAFIEQLLIDPAITDAQHPGVTRSRVRALLPDHRKTQIDAVLKWLDAASVLAPPLMPAAPFRHPRRLRHTDAAALAERLADTPFPHGGESV